MNKVLLSNYSRSKTDVEKRNSAKKKNKKKKIQNLMKGVKTQQRNMETNSNATSYIKMP